MKRQRIKNIEYRQLLDSNDDDTNRQNVPMHSHRIRRENVLEAQILDGDTLQAIALRFNCTIADLKRLNKIEKEIEIHARKTIKVPLNAHSILLSTHDELPIVHKSGQSSPRHSNSNLDEDGVSAEKTSHNQLWSSDRHKLDEKLLVASVSLASSSTVSNDVQNNDLKSPLDSSINDIILKSQLLQQKYTDETVANGDDLFTDPLLLHLDDDEVSTVNGSRYRGGPHAIRGAPRNEFTCSGSDCDISWICLLICILALCFAIPLIYVIYIAEHRDEFNDTDANLFVTG